MQHMRYLLFDIAADTNIEKLRGANIKWLTLADKNMRHRRHIALPPIKIAES
jgi:hypothetical protein